VYGSQTRFAGHVQPQPELTFVDKGPYNTVSVGDINGDGRPDLVFQGNSFSYHIDDWEAAPMLSMRLYVVRGTGTRWTGEQRDTDSVFQPVGYTAPEVLNGGGFNVSFGGDLDGDGSADLVLGAPGQQDPADSLVYLLPGSMIDPE
jgi:hypothetical protein